MATASILYLWALSGSALTSSASDRVTFTPGFYSLKDMAKQVSTPARTVRVARSVAERAAFLALKDRDRSEALALVCDGLGLQADLEADGRTITIRESDKVRTRERRWRAQIFEALRERVFQAVRDAETFPSMDAVARSRLLKQEEDTAVAYTRKLSSSGRNPTLAWVAETYLRQGSQGFRASYLAEEMPLYSGTRGPLVQLLRKAEPSLLTGDGQVTFQPVSVLGTEFNTVLNRDYAGGESWAEGRLDACLLGWVAEMDGFAIGLRPVANLVGNRMFELAFASRIGVGLPDPGALVAGQELIGALFRGGESGEAILDRDAQALVRGLDKSTRQELASEAGQALDEEPLDEKAPFLSQTLNRWVEKTGQEVVMEACVPLEAARFQEKGFQGKYPGWRLRRSQGVLIAEAPMAFWWHGNPLPMASVLESFGTTPKSEWSGWAEEKALASYFGATPARPFNWSSVDTRVSSYYNVPVAPLEAMRAPFAIWSVARRDAVKAIARADSGVWTFPLGQMSETAFLELIQNVRSAEPTFADYYHPMFIELMRGASLQVSWKREPSGAKRVTARIVPPEVERDLLSFFRVAATFRIASL